MRKILTLEFIPANADLGLLVLRVWLGASMLLLHGWGKLLNLLQGKLGFADPLGIGEVPTLLLAILAEVVAAALLVAGCFTRWAALLLAATMAVAFFLTHDMKLKGLGNGELAFIYLAGFVLLAATGAGKYSVDKK